MPTITKTISVKIDDPNKTKLEALQDLLSRQIVEAAKQYNAVIQLEDLSNIRKLLFRQKAWNYHRKPRGLVPAVVHRE